MSEKVQVKLGKIQETLLLPLWGRAVESRKEKPRLVDTKAVEIIDRIDYDFSAIAKNISWVTQLAWVARSLHIDRAILNFMKRYPGGTIVNIGCGLDTTFERIDNGQIRFFDLDLPDVVDLRKVFFTNSERRKTIASSFLDKDWLARLESENGLLFVAAGVFYYFDESQIKDFIIRVADSFPGSELFFDSASPLGVKVANEKVIRDGGMDETAILKWGIKNSKAIEVWDRRIKLVDEFHMFKGFKRGYSLKTRYGLMMSDILNIMSMVHLRIES